MAAVIDIQLLDSPVQYAAPDPHQYGGGECAFLGRTRAQTHPQRGDLVRLSYEAYRPLAERTLRALAQQAIDHFGCLFVRLHHAIGKVPPGEASVFVQVVCGHRAEAFDACRFLIDSLKKEVPIWKREVWSEGTTWAEGTAVRSQRSEVRNLKSEGGCEPGAPNSGRSSMISERREAC